jgi:hypothetical protein
VFPLDEGPDFGEAHDCHIDEFPRLRPVAARLLGGFCFLGRVISRQLRARRGKSVRVTREPAGFADSCPANCEKRRCYRRDLITPPRLNCRDAAHALGIAVLKAPSWVAPTQGEASVSGIASPWCILRLHSAAMAFGRGQGAPTPRRRDTAQPPAGREVGIQTPAPAPGGVVAPVGGVACSSS